MTLRLRAPLGIIGNADTGPAMSESTIAELLSLNLTDRYIRPLSEATDENGTQWCTGTVELATGIPSFTLL